MRPLLLAGAFGLMWFVQIQDGGAEADAPAWGIAVFVAVRLLVDFIGGLVAVSVIRLLLALGRLGLSHLTTHRRQEVR